MADSMRNHPAMAGFLLRKHNIPFDEAAKFVDRANNTDGDNDYIGATLGLTKGKVLNDGEKGIVVGAEPSEKTGEPIATHLYDTESPSPKISLVQFAHEVDRIKTHTTHPDASIGSWFERDARDEQGRPMGIQIDASRVFKNRKKALRATVSREQDAAWDNGANGPGKEGSPISNEDARAELGYRGKQNKGKKSEVRIPDEAELGTTEFKSK